MNFRKILAGVAAGAMVVSSLALPTFADAETSTETYSIVSNDTITFNVDTIKENNVETITFDFDFSNGSWGGGCVGYNTYDTDGVSNIWTSTNWANGDTETESVTVDAADLWVNADDPTDTQYIQLQVWWNAGEDLPVTCTVTYTYAEVETETETETEAEVELQTGSGNVYYTDDSLDNPYKTGSNDCSEMNFTIIIPSTQATYDISSLTYTLTCADDVSFNEYSYIYFVVAIEDSPVFYEVQGVGSDSEYAADEWTSGASFEFTLDLDTTISTGDYYTVWAYTQSWAGAADYVYAIDMTANVDDGTATTEPEAETTTEAEEETTTAAAEEETTAEEEETTTEAASYTIVTGSAKVYYTNDDLDNPYETGSSDYSEMVLAEIIPETVAEYDFSELTYTLTCADDVSFNEYTYLYFVVTVDGVSTCYQVQGITGDDEWTNGLVLADQVLELASTVTAGQTFSVSAYTLSWEGAADEVFTIDMAVPAADSGDTAPVVYLFVIVALAGVALAGAKKFEA